MKKAEETAPKAAKKAATSKKATNFSDEELAAMKERSKEVKTETTRSPRAKKDKSAEAEAAKADLLAKIAEMDEPNRRMATRLHEIIMAAAPNLEPKTWYGQPAYAKDGKIICFFQSTEKFKTRYATLGFNEGAHLDDGSMWPVYFALLALTPADEKKIIALIKKAVS